MNPLGNIKPHDLFIGLMNESESLYIPESAKTVLFLIVSVKEGYNVKCDEVTIFMNGEFIKMALSYDRKALWGCSNRIRNSNKNLKLTQFQHLNDNETR